MSSAMIAGLSLKQRQHSDGGEVPLVPPPRSVSSTLPNEIGSWSNTALPCASRCSINLPVQQQKRRFPELGQASLSGTRYGRVNQVCGGVEVWNVHLCSRFPAV